MYLWLVIAARLLLWRPRYVIGAFFVPWLVVALIFNYGAFDGALAERSRWASGVLEVLGSLVVVVGILGRRRIFGLGSVGSAVAAWLDEVAVLFTPRRPRRTVYIAAAGNLIASGAVTANPVVLPQSVDQRLKQLEDRVDRMDAQANQRHQEVVNSLQLLRDDLRADIDGERRRLADLEERTRELSVASIQPELMGLSWLILGIAVGAWPEVAARLVAHAS